MLNYNNDYRKKGQTFTEGLLSLIYDISVQLEKKEEKW